jgi:hypothetical protein
MKLANMVLEKHSDIDEDVVKFNVFLSDFSKYLKAIDYVDFFTYDELKSHDAEYHYQTEEIVMKEATFKSKDLTKKIFDHVDVELKPDDINKNFPKLRKLFMSHEFSFAGPITITVESKSRLSTNDIDENVQVLFKIKKIDYNKNTDTLDFEAKVIEVDPR